MRLFLAGLLAWLALQSPAALAQEAARSHARLVLVGSGFFPQGKLALYRQAATAHGVTLDYYASPLKPDQLAPALDSMKQADLVLAELPPVQMYRDDKLPAQLSVLPRVVLVERDGQTARGLDGSTGALLAAYARNGGEQNLDALMAFVAHLHSTGRPPVSPMPALVMPKAGIYHPDYKGLAFSDLVSYLAWLGPKVKPGQPVVGIAMFASAVGSDSTAHIDALVRGVEARGGIALPFFRDTDGPVPLQLLTREGQSFADVVVNFEILYRGSVGQDYARLGVPVLQAITYWDGIEAAWRADRQGISPGATSFYLAIPEQAGFIDPLIVAAAKSRTPPKPIQPQMDSLLAKAFNYAALRHKAPQDKRVAIVYYNYPPGEKNLGASGLNLPESLHATLQALEREGYQTQAPTVDALLPRLQRLLSAYYRPEQLPAVAREGLVGYVPMREYRRYLQSLPADVRGAIVSRWGDPERSVFVVQHDGEASFAIPRLQLGNVTLLPQPTRAGAGHADSGASYHDTALTVDHFYLAAYLYLREQAGSDAIVHFGTHGTQEWTYGKERGLSVHDNPMLLVGDVPVVYPYIVDDVGEALQAKRRGRAVVVSHQTPAFGTAGLHGDSLRLHQLIDEYRELDQGAVRDNVRMQITDLAMSGSIVGDLGWSRERVMAEFDTFLGALHDYLDELAEQAQPLGLHSFGVTADEERRLDTMRLMLGKRVDKALALDRTAFERVDAQQLAQEPGRAWLRRHVFDATPLPSDAAQVQRDLLDAARRTYDSLDAGSEMHALLDALSGRYSAPGLGGDPLRVPESLPTGRNLYGFDPMRVPSRAAWQAGQIALDQLLQAYREQHGRNLDKLAFSLWGVETLRHNGILEAQVLAALGVRPVWDDGGRVSGVELIPKDELKRDRVDVVLSATGLYRDQFPVVMQRLNEALALAETAEDGDNAIARHTRDVRERLVAQGLDAAQADRYARTRLFASAQGNYGSGLGGSVLKTDEWDSDRVLAESYLQRMQYAYGPDPKYWGEVPQGINAYAEQLRGTQAAVLSRSSNLYGMLTTDDPFSYLGGLSLAVRHLDGKAPELYISNLRDAGRSRVESASRFLAAELQTRQFHPGWIRQMQREGYAGTLEVVSSMDNFWGWQAVDPGMVRAQQWQEFHDVYVQDKHQLGMRHWFQRSNPHALAQVVERMLEAQRKGYWQPDDATLRNITRTWNELDARLDLQPGSRKLRAHVALLSSGFGLAPAPANRPAPRSTPKRPGPQSPTPAAREASDSSSTKPQPPVAMQVQGLRLQAREAAPKPPALPWWSALPALLAFVAGGWAQRRAHASNISAPLLTHSRIHP